MSEFIEVKNVTKVFDGATIIDDENFTINKGEFVTILGPSGCGKSTTLRMIAGFEVPTSGEILLENQDIVPIPPYKRPVNTVFQHYALFPNLDVYDNVAFGLRLQKVSVVKTNDKGDPILKVNKAKIRYLQKQIKRFAKDRFLDKKAQKERIKGFEKEIGELRKNPEPTHVFKKLTGPEIDERVMRSLQIVDLDEMEDRNIKTLSGGQQQRVAIARAICLEPKILLLDEPLGALDLKMRKDMQLELKEMHRKLGITFIYVTHDQEEALTMSDKIIVMSDGIIQQMGTPTEIYNEPKNAFVADFIGDSNIYNGTMFDKFQVSFLGSIFTCLDDFPVNERVDVVVRPEDVKLTTKERKHALMGRIDSKVFKGIFFQYSIMIGKYEIVAKSIENFPEGTNIFVTIKPDGIHIMKKEFSINIFTDLEVEKRNHITINGNSFAVNIASLLPNSQVSKEKYLLAGNKKYDLTGFKVIATIRPEDIVITDDTSISSITGTVENVLWKGDTYFLLVRTANNEDYIVATPYNFNVNDIVGLSIPPERIQLKAKGDISEYEI